MTGDQKNSVLGKYRYALKSAIHGAGFRTITEYSAYIGTDSGICSLVLRFLIRPYCFILYNLLLGMPGIGHFCLDIHVTPAFSMHPVQCLVTF